MNDTASEASEDESYSVAQFQRTINPAFRSSSPQPSVFESHHDPQSNLAMRMGHQDSIKPPSFETTLTPQKPNRPSSQLDYRRDVHHDPQSDLAMRMSHHENKRPPSRESTITPQKSARPHSQLDYGRRNRHDSQSDVAMRMGHQESNRPPSRETTITPQKLARPPSQIDYRRQAQAQAQTQFQHSQMEALATVPHNEYPTDGMTMFCRTAPPSERSSAASASPIRPSSRDSQSEYSNPTSFSSHEPLSGKQSPVKQNTAPMTIPTKEIQKKRSGFFSSNSPFRRKSKHEKEGRDLGTTPILAPTTPSTWGPSSGRNVGSSNSSPTRSFARGNDSANSRDKYSGSPEPVDPRANFQLNIGPNVFDVASPDSNRNKVISDVMAPPAKELDPIAQALAEIKLAEQKAPDKQSSTRISADHYHGIATPAPPGTPSVSAPIHQTDHAAAQRGTPPPSYNDQTPIKRLDPPKPAFTSAQMQQTTRKYVSQTKDIYGSSRPSTLSGGSEVLPRATSPLPIRSTSPRPGYITVQNQGQGQRGSSPRQEQSVQQSAGPRPTYNAVQDQTQAPRSVSPRPTQTSGQGQGQGYTRSVSPNPQPSPTYSRRPQNSSPTKPSYTNGNTPGNYSRCGSSNMKERDVSPQPQFSRQERPSSSAGIMALQLAEPNMVGSRRGRGNAVRPLSYYGGPQSHGSEVSRHVVSGEQRTRSKSVLDGRKYSQDGRPILHFGRLHFSVQSVVWEHCIVCQMKRMLTGFVTSQQGHYMSIALQSLRS